MTQKVRIDQFLDSEGKITQFPSKLKNRLAILEYLTEKFEPDCTYTEQQVKEICCRWHTFGDHVLLRRELIDYGFLFREPDGSIYRRIWVKPIDGAE